MSKALEFETRTINIKSALDKTPYTIDSKTGVVFDKSNKVIGQWFSKKSLYNDLLQPSIIGLPLYSELRKARTAEERLSFRSILHSILGWSAIKEPDGAFFNHKNNTLYILEAKYQEGVGTAFEKIGACRYLKYCYSLAAKKLPTKPKVELIYVVNQYLVDNYKTVFDYLSTENIDYYVNKFPDLKRLGL